MRTLSMNEVSVVAGGENTLPTVTITYNRDTGATTYSGVSAGTGGAGPSNASTLLFGSQQAKPLEEPGLGQVFPTPVTTVAPIVIAAVVTAYTGVSNSVGAVMDGARQWILQNTGR